MLLSELIRSLEDIKEKSGDKQIHNIVVKLDTSDILKSKGIYVYGNTLIFDNDFPY